jgi:hypothetical protein
MCRILDFGKVSKFSGRVLAKYPELPNARLPTIYIDYYPIRWGESFLYG